jgi:hypothetical protein
MKVIVHVVGRGANLTGTADAASEGTISQKQIETRPILRPGEVLEAIPGLVISQHSGEGKANQYYLRGFQLDHGTDIEGTIAGVPINLPTHAHGQGYSDINWLIPELVSFVEYKKGPYYADQGDFSTAGAYNVYYRNTIAPTVELGAGEFGYRRAFLADSHKSASGNLLYALELYRDDGSLVLPDDYRKINGVLRWSRETPTSDLNVTAWGYSGLFNSTDQIPQRLVDAGELSRYGAIDPSDGGYTSHYALSSEYSHEDAHGETRANVYGYEQYLDLFSNFTYFLDDATDYYNVHANPFTCTLAMPQCAPETDHVSTYTSYCPANAGPGAFSFSCGDQREQQDRRFVSGFDLSRSFGRGVETVVGAGVRNDNISTVGLFLTHDRVRYANGTLSDDHVVERDGNIWAQSTVHVGKKLRIVPGLRADVYRFEVHAPTAADSGQSSAGLVNPKFSLAYAFSPIQEFYLDAGESFHSNDARGLFQSLDPQTHAPIDPSGNRILHVSPLVRASGKEVGYRYSGPRLTSTVALWQLDLSSELIFDGDHGTTSAGGPTRRYGLELSNYYRPRPWLTLDADFSTSAARFTESTLQDGTFVPESLNEVISAGITVDHPSYSASLRARYFGPRTLNTEGTAVSRSSTIFNFQYAANVRRRYQVKFDVLNIFNARADDVEYYYGSWLPQDAANAVFDATPAVNPALGGSGVNDYHLHPSEQRTIRLIFTVHP